MMTRRAFRPGVRATAAIVQLALLTLLGAGCTALGPMAGSTMSLGTPTRGDRTGAEASWGVVGGFYLSDVVQDNTPTNTIHQQAAVWFEPGKLLGPAKGLAVGARMVGGSNDLIFEPMLRYRLFVDDSERVALSVVAFGTYGEGADAGASYQVARGGAELGVESLLTPPNRWAELRFVAGASLTGIGASGTYCVDTNTGWARDCDEDTGETGHQAVDISYALPAGYAGVAVDLFRGVPVFHGLRLTAVFSGGTMPTVQQGTASAPSGPKEGTRAWWSFGFNITVGIGEW